MRWGRRGPAKAHVLRMQQGAHAHGANVQGHMSWREPGDGKGLQVMCEKVPSATWWQLQQHTRALQQRAQGWRTQLNEERRRWD
jgi:hypothetical protein